METGKYSIIITRPDVKKDTTTGNIRLDNKDIIDCYFIEDIYSYGIVGKLKFNDLYGIVERGPFTGNETVYIIYGEDDERTHEFYIYSVNKISQITNVESSSQNAVEITFTDNMFINLTKNRYSRSWTDTLISDIIKDISTNMLDVTSFNEFEATQETLPYFYMPYWTPLESINWLIKRGSGATSKKAGYAYYNNGEGTNFVTLEKLLANKSILNTGLKTPEDYVFESPEDAEYRNKILGWTLQGIDNTGTNSIKGAHVFGYNFATKSLYDRSHEYSTSISQYTMLGRKTLFPDISNDTMMYSLEGDNDTDILDNIYQHNFIRKYNLQQCVSIIVRGSERRHAGAMINIRWPSPIKEEISNRNLAGRFLIKSITHSLNPYRNPPYRQKLILIKNAYSDSFYPGLVKSTKKNVTVI